MPLNFTLLEIDLSSKTVKKKPIDEKILLKFLGGRGLGVRLFFEYADPKIDPLSPSAPFFILTGPLTISSAPLSGRFHAVFKSPLTGTIFDSSCGGYGGVFLKRLKIDGIVIIGKSDTPVVIYIDEKGVKIEDAQGLKGLKISLRAKKLKEIYGEDISYVLCGPSAEKNVIYSNLVSDGRFFGRGGGGAVFNAKLLLGIVIKKTNKIEELKPANKEKFDFVNEEARKWIYANPITSEGLPRFGTSVLMNLINELKLLPSKNFNENVFPLADLISGESLEKKVVKKRACFSCPVACGRVTEKGEGPEYETLWALGANLKVSNLDSIINYNKICAEYGVDTISLGGSISAFLEINDLPFGDEALIEKLIMKTVEAVDEGGEIGKGSLRMCQKYGREKFSMSVKGLELPAYHPLGLYGMALAYGTSNRGGCHLRAYMLGPEVLGIPKLINRRISTGKSGLVIYLQNSHASMDSAIFCRFISLAVTDDYLARLVSSWCGIELSTVEYQKIGERIYNLERVFNIIAGFKKEDDYLPERLIFREYKDMLDEYYRARGWDERGIPTDNKLKELEIIEFLKERYV
jgi:aldehyde:ferredoxin oxidoreductase